MSAKDITDYVDDIILPYWISPDEIVVEHRSNNPKRDFLFVNRNQAKHIPSAPNDTIAMINYLAREVRPTTDTYHSVLIIAFAETATGIGNLLADAIPNCAAVMQTTRESLPGSHCILTFEEEHSHATTHRLLWPNSWGEFDPSRYDYVLFVDDELTTGNTILNFIDAYKKQYSDSINFGVASICNWQDVEHSRIFAAKNIDVFSLIKGRIRDTHAKMNVSINNSVCYTPMYSMRKEVECIELPESEMCNERFIHQPRRDYSDIFAQMFARMELDTARRIRVIGTEEFMYLPIKFSEYLTSQVTPGSWIVCHSTTRSSIDTTSPFITNGIQLKNIFSSAYDSDRQTYLYNLNEYTDVTIVITDGTLTEEFVQQIQKSCDSHSIYFVKINWRAP